MLLALLPGPYLYGRSTADSAILYFSQVSKQVLKWFVSGIRDFGILSAGMDIQLFIHSFIITQQDFIFLTELLYIYLLLLFMLWMHRVVPRQLWQVGWNDKPWSNYSKKLTKPGTTVSAQTSASISSHCASQQEIWKYKSGLYCANFCDL